MDASRTKVIQKYQTSTCEQLWQERAQGQGQPKPEMEQRAIAALRNDPQMRQAFFNKVAAPIVNKMFECRDDSLTDHASSARHERGKVMAEVRSGRRTSMGPVHVMIAGRARVGDGGAGGGRRRLHPRAGSVACDADHEGGARQKAAPARPRRRSRRPTRSSWCSSRARWIC